MSKPRPRSTDLTHRAFERILLIKPSSLGDIIHALPVLRGLRVRYPTARIDWLASTSFAPLLEGHPDITDVIRFDRKGFSRLGRSAAATVDFGKFLSELRVKEYELVIDLQGLLRTGFLTRATGAPVRVGFRNAREGAWAFYNHYIPLLETDEHAVDRNFRVADMLGFAEVDVSFPLPISEADRATAAGWRSQITTDATTRLVAVLPGARWETKVWLPDRFTAVIDALQDDSAIRCVLLGGPDDAELSRSVAEGCAKTLADLTGKTTLREMAAMLDAADVVLCHDSGPMHVAVALEQPIVCLIGPTHPGRTGPYRRPNDVLRVDLKCSPCYLRKLSECRHEHRCMRDLSVEVVVQAIRGRLMMNPKR